MNNNYEKTSFKKLLTKLQEDSWQLELLISGFAIFGLFYANKPIGEAMIKALSNGETMFGLGYGITQVFIFILIFNLLLHILLRGLWIGALGLRYVSGDIEYKNLNYSQKFTTYLKIKVGSFDRYIGKLENYCSVIFAISFLLIFYVLAFVIVITLLTSISYYLLENDSIPSWIAKGVGIPLQIFFMIGMFLTFFDFITQGLLKKKQWVSKIYFPFYWVFSVVTLSFLYRPLIYNFLDNKFGRRISLILLPFYLLIITISSFTYQKSNYISANNNSSEIIINTSNYEDSIKDDDFMMNARIQSKVITDSFLKIHLPFRSGIEDKIFEFNPNLKPEKDKRGLRIFTEGMVKIGFNNSSKKVNRDSLRQAYLKTFNKIYTIKIDSTAYKTDFIIAKSRGENFGFETYISIEGLSKGKHLLTINKLIKKDSIEKKVLKKIPFWYFKN